MKMKIVFFVISVSLFLTINNSWSAPLGDVNLDGKVGIADAIYALQITSGMRPETLADARSFFEITRNSENLVGWSPNYQGPQAQINTSDVNSTVSLAGIANNGIDISIGKSFSNAVGIVGTINVSAIARYASIGFGMHIGSLNGYNLHVNISLQNDPQQGSAIQYQVRTTDSSYNFLSAVAYGYLGAVSSPIGQDIKMGFARIGNEIWFYSAGFPFLRWEPSTTMGARLNNWVWYWEWAGDQTSNVTATFKNIKMISAY